MHSAPTESDAQSLALIAESLGHMFARFDSGEFVRLGVALSELGWSDVAELYPLATSRILAREHALSLINSDLLDGVLIDTVTRTCDKASRAAGSLVLLPARGARPIPAASSGGQVSGLLLGRPQPNEGIMIPLSVGEETKLVVESAADAHIVSISTFDPSVTWYKATVSCSLGSSIGSPGSWEAAVAAGRRTLAAQLVALSRRALDMTCGHVGTRKQYGHAISSFQVVRHRLAQAQAAVDGAQALLHIAEASADFSSARAAKMAASYACAETRSVTLQFNGAVGLTAEHGLHRFLRRAMQLDALLGNNHELERELADDLFAPAAHGLPLHPIVVAS